MRHPIGIMMAGALALGISACTPAETSAEIDTGNVEPPAIEAEPETEEAPMGEYEMGEMPSDADQAAAADAAQAAAESGVVYAGEGQKGGDVSLPMGQVLRIELETIPTAGYVWQVVEKPDFLELAAENTRPTNPALQNLPGFTGGNHYMSFDLRASGEGTGVIKLTESRPWETEEAPSDTFELTVTVTAAE
ncbi:putative lipoprotein [Hyphomonas neptunium ATCC 15444]|uniref:Putative lipoprotein n=2 Tax=Hyphomonas TaxID=85 RepID=Q0C5W7_HYPNA|nr:MULTISPECIES: protease inhibitor I42 family protein [Hyphomonas]ABI78310.1 putative lipoprotein [Hyphomonas neptunium ATCC 15444]KCZ89373.1 putative lipoprotein [Hyphomonas hirschiana VP5]